MLSQESKVEDQLQAKLQVKTEDTVSKETSNALVSNGDYAVHFKKSTDDLLPQNESLPVGGKRTSHSYPLRSLHVSSALVAGESERKKNGEHLKVKI